MQTKSLFISQPMSGLSEEEILTTRQQAIQYIQNKYAGYNIVAIDSYQRTNEQDYNPISAVNLLGQAITKMAGANIIYFAPGWQKSKGCQIENEVARRWLEPTGVILVEDGMDTVDIEMTEEQIESLKKAADEAGMSLHKYVGLKLKESLSNGVAEQIIQEYKNAKDNL